MSNYTQLLDSEISYALYQKNCVSKTVVIDGVKQEFWVPLGNFTQVSSHVASSARHTIRKFIKLKMWRPFSQISEFIYVSSLIHLNLLAVSIIMKAILYYSVSNKSLSMKVLGVNNDYELSNLSFYRKPIRTICNNILLYFCMYHSPAVFTAAVQTESKS